jgi:mannose-6-phosphate isomerase-like protein (cupin superfamily)
MQQPHTEDEVYVVMAGRGTIRVAGEDRPVKPGSVVYVGAGVEHRFHSVDEDLHALVFWAPPYRSRAEPVAAPGEAAAH